MKELGPRDRYLRMGLMRTERVGQLSECSHWFSFQPRLILHRQCSLISTCQKIMLKHSKRSIINNTHRLKIYYIYTQINIKSLEKRRQILFQFYSNTMQSF